MSGYFIAGYVALGLMVVCGSIYIYTLFTYTKYTLFTKAKYSGYAFAFFGLVFIVLLVFAILFLTTFKKLLEKEPVYVHAGLCFGFMGFDIIGFVLYMLIIKLNNKNKIPYDQIEKTDFRQKLAQIKIKIGNVEALKNKILKHHKKYYKMLNDQYFLALERAKDKNISKAEKIADIVMFNDTFAHKWSHQTNNYQLLLTYEFLTLI